MECWRRPPGPAIGPRRVLRLRTAVQEIWFNPAALAGASRGRSAKSRLIPRRHQQFDSNMGADFARVVVDEVPDAVMRDSPQFRPFPKGANRWFLACREYPAEAKARYVGELTSCRCFVLCFHAHGCVSTDAACLREPDPNPKRAAEPLLCTHWESVGPARRHSGVTPIETSRCAPLAPVFMGSASEANLVSAKPQPLPRGIQLGSSQSSTSLHTFFSVKP